MLAGDFRIGSLGAFLVFPQVLVAAVSESPGVAVAVRVASLAVKGSGPPLNQSVPRDKPHDLARSWRVATVVFF